VKRSPDALSYIKNDAGPVGPGQQPPANQLSTPVASSSGAWTSQPQRLVSHLLEMRAFSASGHLDRMANPRRHKAGTRPSASTVSFLERPTARPLRRAPSQPTPPPPMNASSVAGKSHRRAICAACPHQLLDLKPLRHGFVGDLIVTRACNAFRHRAP